VKLENNRIRLRAPEPEDLELLYHWENDTGMWVVSETLEPFSRFQLKEYISQCNRDIYTAKEQRLMIETIESPHCVGIIDMFQLDPFHRKAALGILIGNEYRKQHYASDALEIYCGYAFGYLQLHQLYCEIIASNTVSIQLFEKSGFRCVARLKDWRRIGSDYTDVFLYQRLQPDNNR